PLVACLSPVLATLMRGQVNLMLLAVLCFAAAAELRGRPWRSGLWLAVAVCLKVIPAVLLIYPLWRRDYRCLGGCAAGLVVGLVLIPAAWFGPARTAGYFAEWYNVLARPGLGTGDDHARDKELIGATSTDSQSLGPIIHNTLHLNPYTRPQQHSAAVRLAHWLGGGLLTLVTLLAAGRGSAGHRLRGPLLLGALTLVMLMLSPICHLHYFCLALPLIMGLMALQWEVNGAARLNWGLTILLVVNFAANGVTHLPDSELVRDLGVAAYATLLLWLFAVVTLWRTRSDPQCRLLPVPAPVSVNEEGPLPKAG
ncbi:MAG TPA: glycosyltransferase family 87 protein, partial [Gemmataceae bacterium]|nr:glycosyltransferase family 87 protein [Gemmataceae bacterium]